MRQEGLGVRRPVATDLGSGNAPNFSKPLHPVLQGQQLSHRAGISRRASLQAITASVREGSGGSWNQPLHRHPTPPLLYTPGRQRGLCLQRCLLGMRTSAALHCSSYPETGFGAQPGASPSAASSATWQDRQSQDCGHPSCTLCQTHSPLPSPSNSNFKTAFEASSPRKFPAALQAASSLLAAATFPVTQRGTQQL